ncbi:MAG: YchF/TatD family DNA exonuclease [Alphaproteobacteria bacterium]|nr:YchF/TatD family DNA exonuclease [Alphaproteobacteria bacterium]
MLVDSHCHLDFPEFAPELNAVVERAHAAGVQHMLTIGTTLARFPGVLTIAEAFDSVSCTVGVHPHEADKEGGVARDVLLGHARHDKVVGFGETGLDFFYENSARERQMESFRTHIEAARETGLPVVIHARDADEAMASVLEEEMAKGAFTGLLHCFSSGAELARRAIDLGLYISLSGIITFKKTDELRAIVRGLPHDRVLVETDAPFLAPIPLRGARNEPAFVVHTAKLVAELLNLSEDDLAAKTSENFFRLFAKAAPRA